MSTLTADHWTIRTPSDLVGILPGLVGFMPAESLVIVMVRDSRVVVTMRLDLPERWDEAQEQILKVVARVGAEEVLLAVYSRRGEGQLPYVAEVRSLSDELRRAGVPARDALLIDGVCFWSLMCDDDSCCDPAGRPFTLSAMVEEGGLSQSRDSLASAYALRTGESPAASAYESLSYLVDATVDERTQAAWLALQQLVVKAQEMSRSDSDVWQATLHIAMQDV